MRAMSINQPSEEQSFEKQLAKELDVLVRKELGRRERMKQKQKKARTRKHEVVKLVCSHCRAVEVLNRWTLLHASRQRCQRCGGPLNKPSQA